MTLQTKIGKAKLGLLGAGAILAAGASYSLAQTGAVPTTKVASVLTQAAQELTVDDQALLLSLLSPNSSAAKVQKLTALDTHGHPHLSRRA